MNAAAPKLKVAELLATAVSDLGGSRRAGQVEMAEAVAKAIKDEKHLAVQAGTGTGKSLAYLIPAIMHAQETGTTVIISTATIALQNQLVQRDLPRLAKALENSLAYRPTFAIQKGRANYLCLHKVADSDLLEPENLFNAEASSRLEKEVQRVQSWAQQTETGDRDDLSPGVPDKLWQQLSVRASECLGATRCPQGEDCFAERAREATRNVDIVVTNHALLAIDALSDSTVLPEHDVIIVDEAHELDARITSVSSAQITATGIKMAAKRAGKLSGDGSETKLIDIAENWDTYSDTLAAGRWTQVAEHTRTLLVGLRDEIWTLRSLISKPADGEAANDPDTYAERQSLVTHLLEMHDALVRILAVFQESDPTKQADVVWLNTDDNRANTLNVAPLSVAGLLNTHLFARNTVILTSATLAVGGNFEIMAATWGLSRGTWRGLDVGTPFDPAKAAILYIATALPDPGRDGLSPEALEEIYELIMAAGGRTLGLFSSRKAAQQAAEELRPRLPMKILLQGEDSLAALVSTFGKEENTCLFGTLSLWQGVDVPGRTLSQVIIDRIPFPRPDDPLLQARKDAADAAGRSGFMEVAAAHAALLMAQGTGRLLRSVEDRGVISVLDRRLSTKRYGSYIRSSMPAYWPTTDGTVARAALKRLVGG
ncbi:ATP-dependent DNA helicase [Corynebacterium caspium]|uniref:ATP-dependent DNA helicase n=1 Tax=Corynebacterium caspium TaxID=234828 RepID=UPI0004763F96|nr:ATP-dependent DNA helicase [Corynebacterium caspium]